MPFVLKRDANWITKRSLSSVAWLTNTLGFILSSLAAAKIGHCVLLYQTTCQIARHLTVLTGNDETMALKHKRLRLPLTTALLVIAGASVSILLELRQATLDRALISAIKSRAN